MSPCNRSDKLSGEGHNPFGSSAFKPEKEKDRPPCLVDAANALEIAAVAGAAKERVAVAITRPVPSTLANVPPEAIVAARPESVTVMDAMSVASAPIRTSPRSKRERPRPCMF